MGTRMRRGLRAALAGTLLLGGTFVASALLPSPGATAGTSTPSWTQLNPDTSPPGRILASMAYDPGTGQLVLFGGAGCTNGSPCNDTWTWNGSTWTQQSPATSPPGRDNGASMAYDPATGQLILFGGTGSSADLNDTWTWNGTTWTQLFPATSPPVRDEASMAYDPDTGQLVLFGGHSVPAGIIRSDTWTWNGTTWTEQSPATSPPARGAGSMSFDPANGTMVLFGGYDKPGNYLNDTWTWNGTTWTAQSPASSPSVRGYASMAYDSGTGQLVLFGGGTTPIVTELNDTWTWNGTTWMQQSPATSPSARATATMAYDSGTGQLVLFGGEIEGDGGEVNDTWIYGSPAPSDTVAFNSEGGAAVSPISGPVGSSITLPSDTYPGHSFNGWFTAANGGTKVGSAGSPYTIPAGGITLYAQWTSLCAAGLQPHVLNASYAKGTFTGLFCVNANGLGTYIQGSRKGFGWVTVAKGTTIIDAVGKTLFLAGSTDDTKSSFVELAPTPIKFGTFTLS